MDKLHYEIVINAPVQKVWDKMLQEESYRLWTSAFDPSSRYVGSWDKGSQIKFVGGSDDSGMLAEIAENIPGKFVSIKHLGELKNGVMNPASKPWENAYENYTFSEENGITKLGIELTGIPTEMQGMFNDMWPKALAKLKEICES